MTGLEIALLTIGLIVIVASFVFSSKSDGDTIHNVKDVTFTDKQKEDIKKQIMDILDEQIENVKEITIRGVLGHVDGWMCYENA